MFATLIGPGGPAVPETIFARQKPRNLRRSFGREEGVCRMVRRRMRISFRKKLFSEGGKEGDEEQEDEEADDKDDDEDDADGAQVERASS